MTARPALAFVVQRYGAEVTGGSETLARALAERLASEFDVTVLTSCARDYVTWRNEYAPGTSSLGGVRVRRFPATEERDLASFNALSDALYAGTPTRAEEEDWLRRQGPVVPGLVEALRAEGARFAAVLFFTYLYYPTYWGLQAAPERAILVPTTHDEPPLRFSVFREVFARPRALAFLTPAEGALVRARFDLGGRPAVVAGMGVDASEAPDVDGFRARHQLHGPYHLYAGRIDAGKGCAEMLDFHERYRRECRGAPPLVLIGRLALPEPRGPGVRYLGFLSEPEKRAALAGAQVVLCSSPYESLSIVLLEAFAEGTPVLVNGASDVLVEHCRRSQGGLFYTGREEFVEALDLLACRDDLRRALARNGRRYVDEEYRWDVVLARYRALIRAVSG